MVEHSPKILASEEKATATTTHYISVSLDPHAASLNYLSAPPACIIDFSGGFDKRELSENYC